MVGFGPTRWLLFSSSSSSAGGEGGGAAPPPPPPNPEYQLAKAADVRKDVALAQAARKLAAQRSKSNAKFIATIFSFGWAVAGTVLYCYRQHLQYDPKWDLIAICGPSIHRGRIIHKLVTEQPIAVADVYHDVPVDQYQAAIDDLMDEYYHRPGFKTPERIPDLYRSCEKLKETICMPMFDPSGQLSTSILRLFDHPPGTYIIVTPVAEALALVRRETPNTRVTVVNLQATSLAAFEQSLRQRKDIRKDTIPLRLERAHQDWSHMKHAECGWNDQTLVPLAGTTKLTQFFGRRSTSLSDLRQATVVSDNFEEMYGKVLELIPKRHTIAQQP